MDIIFYVGLDFSFNNNKIKDYLSFFSKYFDNLELTIDIFYFYKILNIFKEIKNLYL